MSEDNNQPEPKSKEYEIEYRFVDHEFKLQYILSRMAEAEQLHFELMVDRLDENHSDYESWYRAVQAVLSELDRLKVIYRKLGGSLGSEFTR
tara:strand:+ start:4910 stop:5185 length:276 start_codon:yes stop_codon:yes gene_type:complete